MIITILITIANTIERCARSSKKKTNKNMTKKSVALHNHSFLITMFECFFFKMNIKYKDLIHVLLPFIVQ